MSDFKQYRRKENTELRPVDDFDIMAFSCHGELEYTTDLGVAKVSISGEDIKNNSPKFGDMIARNPKNHLDQWLVAEQYFKDNFDEITNTAKE